MSYDFDASDIEKLTIVDKIDIYMEEIKGMCPDWTDDQRRKFMLSLKDPLSDVIHETIDNCLADWASVFLKEVNDD